MQLPLFCDGVNYIEVFVIGKKKDDLHYDTNVSDNTFYDIFEKVKKLKYKSFRKTNFKTYNSRMEHAKEDSNENVYEFNAIKSNEFASYKRNFLSIYQKKKQKASYSFPSNERIYDMISNHRNTFKINNLLYLNFQVSENYKGDITKEIFFNVNFAKDCDEQLIVDQINKVIKQF
tara:strand:- start:582 stop:1106 length:525 start_codon:yes stop_codon:yes gene_type:complete